MILLSQPPLCWHYRGVPPYLETLAFPNLLITNQSSSFPPPGILQCFLCLLSEMSQVVFFSSAGDRSTDLGMLGNPLLVSYSLLLFCPSSRLFSFLFHTGDNSRCVQLQNEMCWFFTYQILKDKYHYMQFETDISGHRSLHMESQLSGS